MMGGIIMKVSEIYIKRDETFPYLFSNSRELENRNSMSWLIYYFLLKVLPIQNLLEKGNDWIERKKPTVGISALRYGEFMPIASSPLSRRYMSAVKPRSCRNMLVSTPYPLPRADSAPLCQRFLVFFF